MSHVDTVHLLRENNSFNTKSFTLEYIKFFLFKKFKYFKFFFLKPPFNVD